MQVTSAALATPQTVASVNQAAGTVVLSGGLSAPATAATPNSAATPQYQGTAFTFYAPFTDAQAAALQMDTLGIQAAVKAAEAAGGGNVPLPAVSPGGSYMIDQTIVFATSATATSGATLQGDGASLTVVADLGPSRYALSCGDPTATAANGRGIYLGGGSTCPGEWRGVTLSMRGARIPFLGARP